MSTTVTVAELAERVLDERAAAWETGHNTTVIAASSELTPEDTQAVRRVVARAGFQGDALEAMSRQVSARVVQRVQGLTDSQPVDGGD